MSAGLHPQQDNKLIIALYRESYALEDIHSLAVCRALRAKYPRLAKIFTLLEYHTDQAQTVFNNAFNHEEKHP